MKRAHAALLLVPFLFFAAPPRPAAADADVAIANGHTVLGTLSPAAEQETFRFRVPTLAVINVVLKGKKARGAAEAPAVRFRLFDSFGFEVASSQHLTTATSDKMKNVEVGGTGEYRAVVTSSNAVAGDYQLQVIWKTRTPLHYSTGALDAGITNFGFAADAGSVPTFNLKLPKGSVVRPWLQKFTEPFGSYDQTFPQPGAAVKKLKIKGAPLPRTADYGAFATDTGGAGGGPVDVTITLKVPKPTKAKIDLRSRVIGTLANGDSTVVGAVIGGAGGVVSAGAGGSPLDGASVSIPAGALTTPTAIVLGTGAPIPGAGGTTATGPTVVFGPGGQHFRSAVTITIPFDPALLAGGSASSIQVLTRDDRGRVSPVTVALTVDLVAGTISFPSSHFSAYRAFGPPRKPRADLNADGIDDLVLPAALDSSGRGAVFVFFGRADLAPLGGAKTSDADAVLTGKDGATQTLPGDFFGASVATGDVNGDGIADLVVGASRVATEQGAVYVFFGGTAFASKSSAQADAVLTPHALDHRFGAALAVADVTGDGEADVLVGAPLSNRFLTDGGAVYRFAGGPGFTSATASPASVFAYTPQGPNDHLGVSIAAGDLETDGKADVVLGADQLMSQGNGKVYVFLSSKSYTSPAQAGTSTLDFSGLATGDEFGASVAVGDLNQDGVADLAVGAPAADDGVTPALNDIGLVYVFHGKAGLAGLPADQADRRIGALGPAVGDRMGESVAVGNVIGGSAADLLATAPGADDVGLADPGRLFVVLGGTTYPKRTDFVQGQSQNHRLGVLLTHGDFNGDGFTDVVVASPHANSDSGRAVVLLGPGVLGAQFQIVGNGGQALGRRDVRTDGTF